MSRVRTAWLAAGAIVVAVGAGVGAFARPDGAHPPAPRQTYVQFNLCGNACNRGGVELGVVTDLARSIRAAEPFAVTLNEVCENQYAELTAGLDPYQGRFDPTGPRCRNGTRYGNAVLVLAASVDLVGSWLLPNPARDEARRLMCLRAPSATRTIVVCVTHVSNEDGNIAPQVRAVAALLQGLPDDPILLGGDFNTDPDDPRLDPVYGPCYGSGRGAFREADSPGCASRSGRNRRYGSDIINEHTYGQHKFDYLFLSDGHWSAPEADATPPERGRSDHGALWASAILAQSG
jgi:endonuclease/exonuclease/phosphatase family metal-dependent hydrolase